MTLHCPMVSKQRSQQCLEKHVTDGGVRGLPRRARDAVSWGLHATPKRPCTHPPTGVVARRGLPRITPSPPSGLRCGKLARGTVHGDLGDLGCRRHGLTLRGAGGGREIRGRGGRFCLGARGGEVKALQKGARSRTRTPKTQSLHTNDELYGPNIDPPSKKRRSLRSLPQACSRKGLF